MLRCLRSDSSLSYSHVIILVEHFYFKDIVFPKLFNLNNFANFFRSDEPIDRIRLNLSLFYYRTDFCQTQEWRVFMVKSVDRRANIV
jgi:hypothetical protein